MSSILNPFEPALQKHEKADNPNSIRRLLIPKNLDLLNLLRLWKNRPLPLDEIQVDAKLNFKEEPVEILEREFKKLKRSRIAIVKIMPSRMRKEGERVGRGGMGKGPMGDGVNRNVEGVNGDVGGAPDFSTIIAQQLQNLLPAFLAQVGNQGNVGNQNGNVVNENVQENVRNELSSGNRVSDALTDEAVRNGSIKKVEKIGNVGEPSKDKIGRDDTKRTRTGNSFAITANPIGKENTSAWPKCTTCNSYNAPRGPCRTCFNYNRPGHFAKDYRVVPRNVNPVNVRNPTPTRGACYECGSTDHLKPACPRLNRAQGLGGNHPNQAVANNGGHGHGNPGNQARGRAFMLGAVTPPRKVAMQGGVLWEGAVSHGGEEKGVCLVIKVVTWGGDGGGRVAAWDSSDRHLFRLETWKVLWTLLSSSGSSSLYATGPIRSRILNGPMYRGFLVKCMHRYAISSLMDTAYRTSEDFPEVQTVHDIFYPTCRAACEALCLLGYDNKWDIAMQEACASAKYSQLRFVFAHILTHCEVTDPLKLWTKYWKEMSHDILGRNNCGKSLQNFGLGPPPPGLLDMLANRLLMEERNYNQEELQQQKAESVPRHWTKNFPLENHQIALALLKEKCFGKFASSVCCLMHLPSVRTAHSRFKIPIELIEESLYILTMPHRLFGGKSVLLGGDFRQTLLVKKGASKMEVIASCISELDMWPHFRVFTLTENMRLSRPGVSADER
ncbi:putative reverse transcriptase domain-containing protein [Tanacetum coccineum]|uniref:ATP-dependent DNA helicase n=1 Tax=Tanacetum coccineum TaxID=301880 RepID=A0ABQ5DKM3_9ASTR